MKVNGLTVTTDKTPISYKAADTPIVSKITPDFGTVIGNENIAIDGLNFGTDKSVVEVLIDNISCEISSVTATKIQCVTGKK